jgi:flagellar assembly protein FliH
MEVKREEDIRLFVSPMHYHATVDLTNELSKVTNTDIVVYPDESKGENGCIIETKYGQIDASLDSQLDELKEKLLEFVGDQHDRNHRDS